MRRNLPPGLILAVLLPLAVAGAAVVWPDSSPDEATVGTTVIPGWPAPDAEEVAALPEQGCGVVRFTPPKASAAHEAELCRPSDPNGRAVVLIHGGGGYSGDRDGLRPWARWYRSQGLVTLAIDYTLVGDGTRPPVYPAPERDVKAAVQYLRRMSDPLELDPEAIVVHGSSAGARLGAQVHVTPGDPWFAGDDLWPGVPDHSNGLVAFYGYYDGTSLVSDDYYGGPSDSDDPAVRERVGHADSIAQAGGATGPALLFHGDVDGLVGVDLTERFGRALAEGGTDVRTFILVDENHAFDQRPGDPFTDVGRLAAREIRTWLDEELPAR